MEPQSDQSYHPTLSQHISNTSTKNRFELDIDSHDNKRLDGGSTWASKDWCVDNINSRKLLREQHNATTGSTTNITSNDINDTPGSTEFDNKWYDELNNANSSMNENEDGLYKIEKRSDILNKRTRSRSRSRRPSSFEGMTKDDTAESKLSEDHHSRHSGGERSRHSGERSVGATSYYSRSNNISPSTLI